MAETQIEFVGSQLCSEMFFSGCSGFPLFDLHSPQLVEHSCSAKSVECRSLVSLDIRPRVPFGTHDPNFVPFGISTVIFSRRLWKYKHICWWRCIRRIHFLKHFSTLYTFENVRIACIILRDTNVLYLLFNVSLIVPAEVSARDETRRKK